MNYSTMSDNTTNKKSNEESDNLEMSMYSHKKKCIRSKRGVLIAFAGPDACGKTTIIADVIRKLVNADCSNKWAVFKYPNRDTPIGKKINSILKGDTVVSQEVEIKFFAYNRAEDKAHIINLLKSGVNVILDRYVHCSLAYTFTSQVRDIICHNKYDIITMEQALRYDKGNIMPDFVFLVKGNYLHLRDDVDKEIKDYDGHMRELLYNNYIAAFIYTKSKFAIVDNTMGESGESDSMLDKISDKVITWIERIMNDDSVVERQPLLF